MFIVLGGELENTSSNKFSNLANVDMVGVYPDYQTAEQHWRSKAQMTVDNALMRYFILPLEI